MIYNNYILCGPEKILHRVLSGNICSEREAEQKPVKAPRVIGIKWACFRASPISMAQYLPGFNISTYFAATGSTPIPNQCSTLVQNEIRQGLFQFHYSPQINTGVPS